MTNQEKRPKAWKYLVFYPHLNIGICDKNKNARKIYILQAFELF
jgi:hypothetical protein